MQIRLEYHFEPGSDNDGVTFRLPLDFGTTVSPNVFDWLVPGLLHEKLTYLLKALPKSIRKKLVPINDTVNRLRDDMEFGSGSLFAALEASILKQFKLLIQRSDWTSNLPPHLLPRFLLFDNAGEQVCSGRHLKEMVASQGGNSHVPGQAMLREEGQELVKRWKNTEHITWNFSGLPSTIPLYTPQGEVAGFLYSTLSAQPEKGCIKIVFEKSRETANNRNKQGILFLYRLPFSDQYKALKKHCSTALSGPSANLLIEMGKPQKEVVNELLDFILTSLFGPIPEGIPQEQTFGERIKQVQLLGLYKTGQKIFQDFTSLLRARRTARETIRKYFSQSNKRHLHLPEMEAEFLGDLNEIFPGNLLSAQMKVDLQAIDRQLQSLCIRLERFYTNPGKDKQKAALLTPHLRNLKDLMERREELSEEGNECVLRYRNMVNEYKISVFSPEIKTRESVSPKKLDKQWRIALSKC